MLAPCWLASNQRPTNPQSQDRPTKFHRAHFDGPRPPDLTPCSQPSCVSLRRSSNASSLCSQNSAGFRKSVRPFKGIICDDVCEFESHMPRQAVGSLPPTCECETLLHAQRVRDVRRTGPCDWRIRARVEAAARTAERGPASRAACPRACSPGDPRALARGHANRAGGERQRLRARHRDARAYRGSRAQASRPSAPLSGAFRSSPPACLSFACLTGPSARRGVL
jgi:hypothetical protein